MVTVLTNSFSAYLAERFGHRRIAMIGGIISSVALMASSFATSLSQLYLSYGVLLGIGYSFVHLPSYVMVARYFHKRLSIAMGIALAGTGIGQCVMAFILQTLVDMYGWRATFMILSGLTLNLCVAAALLRPLTPIVKKKKKKSKNPNECDFCEEMEKEPTEKEELMKVNGDNYYRNTKNTWRPEIRVELVDDVKTNTVINKNNNNSQQYQQFSPNDVWRHHSISSESSSEDEDETFAQSTLLAMAGLSYGSGFLWMPHNYAESTESEGSDDVIQPAAQEEIPAQPEILAEKPKWNISSCFEKFKKRLKKSLKVINRVMDFSLWKQPVFVVIQLCFLFHYSGHAIVTSHLVKRARDYGLPDIQGSMLVAFMGITQSIGRIMFGCLGNLRCASPVLIYSISTLICGICAIASVYLFSYAGQMVAATVFGLFMGSYITMIPVICTKYFGPENFRTTSAFSFQLQGVGHVIGSPLGGWMRDISGVYDSAFILSGVSLIMASFLILLVPHVSAKTQHKSPKKTKGHHLHHSHHDYKTDEEIDSEILQLIITTV
nr:PREDICTED: monocarboxylate transporter 12-like isoform X2 [Saccoglossus kowalevskii]